MVPTTSVWTSQMSQGWKHESYHHWQ